VGLDIKFNPALLEAAIAQIGERAIKGMSAKMRRVAIRMRDLARQYAPDKTGLLQDEIHYSSIPGKRGRLSFVVWIDLDAARRNAHKRGGTLKDYAFIMEDNLLPYGSGPFNLGRGSIAKAATGKKVGGRFLQRAFEDATRNLEAEMAVEVRRVLESAGGKVPAEYDSSEEEE
jgi:hypothetical protein